MKPRWLRRHTASGTHTMKPAAGATQRQAASLVNIAHQQKPQPSSHQRQISHISPKSWGHLFIPARGHLYHILLPLQTSSSLTIHGCIALQHKHGPLRLFHVTGTSQTPGHILSFHIDSQSREHTSFSSSQAPEIRSFLLKAIVSAG